MAELEVVRRQVIAGGGTPLASFEDGTAFITRHTAGKGQVLFCATQPVKDWSDLDEGIVLVPMLQRLLDFAGRRFAAPVSVECGEWEPDANERWTTVDSSGSKNVSTQSGVYRSGTKMVAVNRPAREDDRELVDATRAKALLGPVPIYMFDERQSGSARVQSELWRLFLIIMALCLVVEGFLILPEKMGRRRETDGAIGMGEIPPKRERKMEEVGV
jgi:hypothetical protein